MIRHRIAQSRKSAGRRFSPVLLVFVLLANLLSPLAPLASSAVQVAGLDDSNSIMVCTEGGFRRVALADLGIGSATEDIPEDCAEYCSLSVVAFAGQVVIDPSFAFVLETADHATRVSIQTSNRILATANPNWKRPRGPPTLS